MACIPGRGRPPEIRIPVEHLSGAGLFGRVKARGAEPAFISCGVRRPVTEVGVCTLVRTAADGGRLHEAVCELLAGVAYVDMVRTGAAVMAVRDCRMQEHDGKCQRAQQVYGVPASHGHKFNPCLLQPGCKFALL